VSSLYDLIEARFLTDALPALSSYIEIPCISPSYDPEWRKTGAIEEAIEQLSAWAKARRIPGLSVEIQRPDDRSPAIVIDIPAAAGGLGTALLYGHLDKQPPLGDWAEGLDPFRAVRRDDRLYGRGGADDGYAIFAALGAIEALSATAAPHGRLLILIEASEESGSPDLEAHLDLLSTRLDAVDLVICLDSGALDYERLWVTTSLRGNIGITLEVAVLEHGIHSGEGGGVVPSSFRILRQLLDRIEDAETGEMLLDELSAQPPEHHLAAAAQLSTELHDPLASHFPTLSGVQLMGRDGADRLVRQSWSAALAVTGIDGAPSTDDAGNVLRASTCVKLSIRLPPNVDAVLAQDAVIAVLVTDPPSGATITATPETPAQGWVAPAPARWLADALDEASDVGFGHRPGFLGEGGSIPFLAELAKRLPQAQLVATGLLGPGSNAHGPDEMLHIPTTIALTTALASLLTAHGGRSAAERAAQP